MTHQIADSLVPLAVPVSNLAELPGNPRTGNVEAIARSFRVFGQRKALVARQTGVDDSGAPVGYVTAGNHGLKAARDELGWSHVAVVWIDEDETTAAAFALADNKTGELGSTDDELLARMLADVAVDDELLAATAFGIDELETLAELDDELAALLDTGTEVETPPLTWGPYELDDVVAAAFEHYRQTGVPYRHLSISECMQELNALAALEGDRLVRSTLGYAVADTYHPHRFEATIPGTRTLLDVFNRDDVLEHALRMICLQGNTITDSSLLGVLAYVRNAQVASNFRPGFALSMLRRFAFDDAVVLDTSTGYGGRLVAFLSSSCGRYIGVDPNTVTHESNVRMATDLLARDSVELINEPAEDVDSIEPSSCDFAFTSPPYFAKEHYSDEPTQSCNRYDTGEAWRDGFLRPMLALQYRSLRRDRHAVINIADVKLGSQTYPLVDWTINAAVEAGFELVRRERFPLGRVPGRGIKRAAFEPVLIFHKS